MSLIKSIVLTSWGPGGWSYYQPETNWHAPGPLEHTFQEQVQNIIKMREANPRFNLSTDPVRVAQELEEFTVQRWSSVYSKAGLNKFLEVATDVKKKPESPTISEPRSLLNRAAALVGTDTDALEEWLGAGGKAVSEQLANTRAQICAVCPGNDTKIELMKILTVPAAEALRLYLSLKNRMKLATALDPKLGMCEPCRCHLPLKVWAPISHIRDNMKPETAAKLVAKNPKCWVMNEQ